MKKKSRSMESAWSQDPTEAQKAYLIRLCEILYRSRPLLAIIDTENFKDFSTLYSKDVVQGLDLLQTCVKPLRELRQHSPENYAQVLGKGSVLNPRAYTPVRGQKHPVFELQEPTKKVLSIFNQLEQILARWTAHQWIINNSEIIKWLYRRRQLYPQILTHCAGAPLQVGEAQITLPYVNIDWLIDLVYSAQFPKPNEKLIANRLCVRKNHSALLSFSSHLPSVELMLRFAPDLINMKIRQALIIVSENKRFFSGLLNDVVIFSQRFIDYVRSNHVAKDFASKLGKHYAVKLRALLAEDNILELMNNPEKLEYYAGLLKLLVGNVINNRLQLLIELAKITSQYPEHSRRVLSVATWLEQYRNIIGASFRPQSEWGSWLVLQPNHEPTVRAFSTQLSQCLLRSADVRPAKIDGNWQNFPSGTVCFMDCFTGLVEKERSNDLSPNASDVLLYQLLSDERNIALVRCIDAHREALTPIFEAFRQEEALLLEQMRDLVLSEPTEENVLEQEEGVVEDGLSPVKHREPRGLLVDFEESIRDSQRLLLNN